MTLLYNGSIIWVGGKTMYTIKTLSTELKVHPNTVRNWIRDGKLEVIKVGKGIRITEEQLQKVFERRTT